MPDKTPRTKAEKQSAVHTVMNEFSKGKLRSGSKKGPVVKNPAQAKAIAMSESGQSKPDYDRKAHFKGNPGFPSDPEAKSPPETYAKHESREQEVMGAGYKEHEAAERKSYSPGGTAFSMPRASGAHGFGHTGSQKQGHHRMSGHPGAHRIGKK